MSIRILRPGIQPEPGSCLIFRISHWDAANLEPSVNTISVDNGAQHRGPVPLRLFVRLDYARKVLRMNDLDEGPVLRLLIRFPEIFQGLPVKKLHVAQRFCASPGGSRVTVRTRRTLPSKPFKRHSARQLDPTDFA